MGSLTHSIGRRDRNQDGIRETYPQHIQCSPLVHSTSTHPIHSTSVPRVGVMMDNLFTKSTQDSECSMVLVSMIVGHLPIEKRMLVGSQGTQQSVLVLLGKVCHCLESHRVKG